MKEYENAEKLMYEVIKSPQTDANLYYAYQNLGVIHLYSEQYTIAINFFKQAIAKQPEPLSLINLADAYRLKGDMAIARELTDELMRRDDLSVRDSDMVHLLDLELKGLDATYYRKKIEQPDPLAEVTRAQAAHGADIAQVTLKQLHQQQQAAELRQRIVAGSVLLLLLCIGMWYWQRRRTQQYHARLQAYDDREPNIRKLFTLLENGPDLTDLRPGPGPGESPNGHPQ
ncbi:MAG: hypothetical protein WBB45_19895 [Cyclobacteriaceae bacterium]